MSSFTQVNQLTSVEQMARKTKTIMRETDKRIEDAQFIAPTTARIARIASWVGGTAVTVGAVVAFAGTPVVAASVLLGAAAVGVASNVVEKVARERNDQRQALMAFKANCQSALKEMKELHSEIKHAGVELGADASSEMPKDLHVLLQQRQEQIQQAIPDAGERLSMDIQDEPSDGPAKPVSNSNVRMR